jgi:hypothetical protein
LFFFCKMNNEWKSNDGIEVRKRQESETKTTDKQTKILSDI